MKNSYLSGILMLTFLCLSFSFTQAQKHKIKIKKDIAYVDGLAYLSLADCNPTNCTFKSLDGNDLIILLVEYYKIPNPHSRNPKSKAPYQTTVTRSYTILRFLDSDEEFEVELTRKGLVQELFNTKSIDMEGNLSMENIQILKKKYAKDVSGNRPIQIISN